MKIEVTRSETGIILSLSGVLKKEEAKQVADTITELAADKPKKLALDCTGLAAVAFDSMPILISALERARIGKGNVRVFGCNSVVERVIRGSGFERIGTIG